MTEHDPKVVARATRRLLELMRTDAVIRTAVNRLVETSGHDTLLEMAKSEPQIVLDVVESLDEMTEDENAMSEWYRNFDNVGEIAPLEEAE